ncbi:hypothetical protein RRG08_029230 [Elysia crispata]|uniref:Uncharacterized protein n=1 Tax=Elysia crispata TaxID=231223 RepID=A0AAE1AJE6_9GAST|nr:hypothetical protein RRG08_029230 [Elysia crispata]
MKGRDWWVCGPCDLCTHLLQMTGSTRDTSFSEIIELTGSHFSKLLQSPWPRPWGLSLEHQCGFWTRPLSCFTRDLSPMNPKTRGNCNVANLVDIHRTSLELLSVDNFVLSPVRLPRFCFFRVS